IVVPGSRDTGLAALPLQPVNFRANSTALGDLNGDGFSDLVVAYSLDSNSGGVAVFPGDGAGGFNAPALYPATRPVFVTIRDFTRDGKPDIAVVDDGTRNIIVLINDGGGKFPTSRQTPTTLGVRVFGVGDFTNDGKPDLIVNWSDTGFAL